MRNQFDPKQTNPDDIIREIEAKIGNGSGKIPIGPIVTIIKKKLPGRDYNPHVDRILEFTCDKPWFTKLSLEFVTRISGDLKTSEWALLRRLVIINRRQCSFPIEETRPALSAPIRAEEESTILKWIDDSREKNKDSDWCRAALVSLLTMEKEPFSKRTIIILQKLLETMYLQNIQKTKKKEKQKESHKDDAQAIKKYVKRITSVFKPDKFEIKNLAFIQEVTNPFLRLLRDCETNLSQVTSELSNKQHKLREKIQEAASLESEKQELFEKTIQLEKDFQQIEDKLHQNQEDLRRLRIWWEEKTESDKVAHLSKFKNHLQHEVTEAIICLDGDKPNIPMALDRLQRIKNMASESGGRS